MPVYRRVLCLVLLVAFLIFQPASSLAHGWEHIAAQVARSSTQLWIIAEQGIGSCTAFSIDEKRGHYLTAAHCNGGQLFIDDQPVIALKVDEANDVMVVKSVTPRPALKWGNPVRQGQMVGAYGFALGVEPKFHAGIVSATRWFVPDWAINQLGEPLAQDFPGPWTALDFPLIHGMSGGPIVNENGRVVGVNQWGWLDTGYSRDIVEIRVSTSEYWAK